MNTSECGYGVVNVEAVLGGDQERPFRWGDIYIVI